jgi:hypothetical protein
MKPVTGFYFALTETVETNKFWEELTAYFPSYDMVRIENNASNNSIVAYLLQW